MQPDCAVEIRGISKSFQTRAGCVAALSGVDLAVRPGEFVALLGPTGCGKTTLLNIVAGLDRPDTGTVEVAGRADGRASVPCVFQHYALFPWRSVLRNVTFGPELKGVRRRPRRTQAMDLLEQVGLAPFAHAYPHELSGGMRQRAAIAQALALNPTLLLMDEPFGALDDRTRRDLQELIAGVWARRGMTILFVTHSIDEAIALADRVVVFTHPPGRPAREVAVDLPRPRDRLGAAFAALHMEIRLALAQSDSPRQTAENPTGGQS